MGSQSPVEPANDSAKGDGDYFPAYLEYNKVLRTWFVAFGIGGPALLLVNKLLIDKLIATSNLRCVAIAFMSGAVAQVIGAMLNKIANWYVYLGKEEKFKSTWQYKVSLRLLHQFWIDISIDIFTVFVFGYAAWKMLSVFSI
jgi:hypothetical protein